MKIQDIHFHDSVLLRVIEVTNKDELCFEVDYPIEWENNIFQRKNILFTEVKDYQVFEIPFYGSPTILNIAIIKEENNRTTIQIDTNAGYRRLSYKTVELK